MHRTIRFAFAGIGVILAGSLAAAPAWAVEPTQPQPTPTPPITIVRFEAVAGQFATRAEAALYEQILDDYGFTGFAIDVELRDDAAIFEVAHPAADEAAAQALVDELHRDLLPGWVEKETVRPPVDRWEVVVAKGATRDEVTPRLASPALGGFRAEVEIEGDRAVWEIERTFDTLAAAETEVDKLHAAGLPGWIEPERN